MGLVKSEKNTRVNKGGAGDYGWVGRVVGGGVGWVVGGWGGGGGGDKRVPWQHSRGLCQGKMFKIIMAASHI